MSLTVKRLERLTKPGRYADGQGLYLQVSPTRVKSWLFRYERGGAKKAKRKGIEKWMGLGPLHTVNLPEARERARKARQLLLDGIDPRDARDAERAAKALAKARALTFEEAAKQYFDSHEAKWKNHKHTAQFLSTLKAYAFPVLGKLPVAEIDTPLVLKAIEPIWADKTETANRTRNRIESILDWATVRGFRTGDNPARWKGHLSEVLPARGSIQKVAHHPALPYDELPTFITELAKREGIAAKALEFLILTAARTGEVIGATWDEIDLRAKVWTVPAGRIKGGKEHRVPLSDRAVKLLRALPQEDSNRFVFIGSRQGSHLSDMSLFAVLQRMNRGDITVHGFRSTFRDWCAEETKYPNHVVEMALAHVISNAVEEAYRRGDLFAKRVTLMNEWAKFCSTPVVKESAKVISLHKRRR